MQSRLLELGILVCLTVIVEVSCKRMFQESQTTLAGEASETFDSGSLVDANFVAYGPLLNSVMATEGKPDEPGCMSVPFKGTAEKICGDLALEGWKCFPRVLGIDGQAPQANDPNDQTLCPAYTACHCQEITAGAGADAEKQRDTKPREFFSEPNAYEKECKPKCEDVLYANVQVSNDGYQEPIESDLCTAYQEACVYNCQSYDKENPRCLEQCTMRSCVSDFPEYEVDFFQPFKGAVKGREGKCDCWGRLAANSNTLRMDPQEKHVGEVVIDLVKQYQSKAKCCGRHEVRTKAPVEYKWMAQSELVDSGNPFKYFAGTKVCPKAKGWHNVKGVTSQEECDALASGKTAQATGSAEVAKKRKEDLEGKVNMP